MDIRERTYLPSGWRQDHTRLQITNRSSDEDEVQIMEEGEEVVTINCHYAVCGCCDGRGTVVNPSIDAHGIGAEEWNEWDPEEREGYMKGRYDIECPHCEGKRVVLTPNEDDPGIKVLHQAWHDEASYRAEVEAERRMGA
jgi:predicted methyltransferase